MATLSLSSGTIQQSTFDKTGDGFQYDTIFLKNGNYIAAKPYQFNSGTTLTGDPGAIITLAPSVSETLFPAMTPVFGQIEKTISDITVENITFCGNWDKQTVYHGDGYHNFIGLSNCSGLKINNITAGDNKGDIARIKDSKDILFSGNKINGCGHDGLFTERCKNVEACNNKIKVRINSGLRCKGSSNVSFHNNNIQRVESLGPATGPLIQVENSRANETTNNVQIFENYLEGAQGPGIWAAAHTASSLDAAKNLIIRNNLIKNCGNMPASINLPTVAGVSVDGWNDVLIENNTIDSNLGYGIYFGKYLTTSANTGYTATVRRNIITNTKKNLVGSGGTGIYNQGKYDLTLDENCMYGNVANGITGINDILSDPLFVSPDTNDYRLRDNSPCRFSGYQLGAYTNAEETPTELLVSCSGYDADIVSKTLTGEYEIYRRI